MKEIDGLNSISCYNEEGRITTALLLAAGTGSRLRPLTNFTPKCLTEVNGTSILERLVCCLRQNGFKRLVIVVGHLDHCVREFIDKKVWDLQIDYILNPLYETTNNIYSLWLAKEKIDEPFLLVESDLVFDSSLLEDMLYPNRIAVSHILPWMNGATVTIDHLQNVTAFRLGVGDVPWDVRYKTVNIYSLSKQSWHRVVERLDRHIFEGSVNGYYERVFEEMVADGTLSLKSAFFDAKRWYEIDTFEDLHEAKQIFSENIADKIVPCFTYPKFSARAF